MNWVSVESSIEPPKASRPLLCFCPKWCDNGYQVAFWNGKEFHYEDQPNENFSQHVEEWAIFLEAD